MAYSAASPPGNVSPTPSDGQSPNRPAAFPAEYEAVKYVGGGAFSEVWHARHRESGEDYAVKLLRPEWDDYPVARSLLENEVEVGARSCPYVVRVFAADLEHVPPYLVMEWLDGESLEDYLTRCLRLPYPEAIWITRQCAQGLENLRQAGFTHGDVKPSNIQLRADGSLKLLDLGFARSCRKIDRDVTPALDVLTGTPEYLAPEALSTGWQGGVARDIYSLGVTLFRMLACRLPFPDGPADELLRSKLGSTPPGVRQFAPDVPRELEQLIGEMLAKQPVRRPQSLKWLIRRLLAWELETFQSPAEAA